LGIARLVLAAVTTTCLLACDGFSTRIPDEYRSFFELPFDQRRAALADYSLEDQLELVLLAQRVNPPGDPLLWRALARTGGQGIVPVLVDRLARATDEIEIIDLARGAFYLRCLYHVGTQGDDTLTDVLLAASERARTPYWKSEVLNIRRDLLTECSEAGEPAVR
jgi:hypothetical protein